MNISYNWLKELIDLNLPAEETAKALTRVGLTVEGVHRHGDDFVFDIDLTSNRPDCLSHLGVARELGVITGKPLNESLQLVADIKDVPYPAVLASDVVRIEDADLCNRFTARIIRGVKVGPSPQWLVDRLEAIGERAINNIADITNYVMHELGQPMHSFDFDKLAGNRIVVRRARPGETITTLDEAERKLDNTILAICDAEKPVAVAGVMGGFDSGISDSTVNVLLEVAYFRRENIRQTSRKLGLATEASYRFERGVDIQNLIRASKRATELICELAGGQAGEFIDVYPVPFEPTGIESMDIAASVERLTGIDVSTEECIRILTSLGIEPKKEESNGSDRSSIVFVSPSWRHDIAIEEDLVEEIARHAGYENIADELPPAYGAGEYQATEVGKKLLRQTLAVLGFDEALSYSFIDTKFDGVFEVVPGLVDERSEQKYITLRDSVIEGAIRMRPTLLPGMIEAVRLNFNHQRRDIRLFEIGKVFAAGGDETGLPIEREYLALALTGGDLYEDRVMPVRQLDFYDAKGSLEAALRSVGFAGASYSAADVKHLRPGQSASVSVNGSAIGFVGRLNDEISANYKFKQPVFVAELDLQTILSIETPVGAYRPLPKYPASVRDISLLVKRSMNFATIREAIEKQGVELCRRVDFVDVYEGKGLAADERSLTIRLEYRSDERTLIDDEVDAVHEQILAALERELGIKPRS